MSSRPRYARRPEPPDEATGIVGEAAPSDLDVVVRNPLCAEPPVSALDSDITPSSRFFIRNHFPAPVIDPAAWRLVLDGDVERPLTLTFDDLRTLPRREVVALLECAGNSRRGVNPPPVGVRWANGAVGTAAWAGVPLAELLRRAGVRSSALEVVFEGADHGREPSVAGEMHYGMSVSLDKANDPDTLLADTMNGGPLSVQHGSPARMLVPGWYGMASVKWVVRIRVISQPYQGYYRTGPYVYVPEGADIGGGKVPVTVLRVKSLITWPSAGDTLEPGTHRVRGAAWSGQGSVSRVEVSTGRTGPDSPAESWRSARLAGEPARHGWTRWEAEVSMTDPGYYILRVRATDTHGNVQPAVSPWNFHGVGTNSIHQVPVIVADHPTGSD